METQHLAPIDPIPVEPSETSLEGWKHWGEAQLGLHNTPFRNFLRGMETVRLPRRVCLGPPSETSLEGWKQAFCDEWTGKGVLPKLP